MQEPVVVFLFPKCHTSFGVVCVAGRKGPIPHAIYPFLSTSDVNRRVVEEYDSEILGGPFISGTLSVTKDSSIAAALEQHASSY